MSKMEFRPPGRLELLAVGMVLFLTAGFWAYVLVDEPPEIYNRKQGSENRELVRDSRDDLLSAFRSHEWVPRPELEPPAQSPSEVQSTLEASKELNRLPSQSDLSDEEMQKRIALYEKTSLPTPLPKVPAEAETDTPRSEP